MSATLVELKRRLFGALPVVESRRSQLGRVAVFTEKKGFGSVFSVEVMLTSTNPAVPEPLT